MISTETVTRVVDHITRLPDEEAQLVVTQMSGEQPALLAYMHLKIILDVLVER